MTWPHSIFRQPPTSISRRAMLRGTGAGFGYLSLSGLLAEESKLIAKSSQNSFTRGIPHFMPKAKRVIFLFMHGGPSSIDILDPKERLNHDDGKPLPIERPLSFDNENPPGPLMKSPWIFRPGGESGLPISDLFPHVRRCADDLCVIRSMVGEGVDHGAAMLQTFTGSSTFIRPSMGSWVVYGLGTENQNLPGFILIKPALSHGGAKNWSSAFLPGTYQGTALGHGGLYLEDVQNEPIKYLINKRFSPELARYQLEMLQNMNRRHQLLRTHDTELEARIQAFELAFRMQTEAPEAFEINKESEPTKKLYGLEDPVTKDFAWQCLLARRLAERGVRYIQCTHTYMPGGVGWDQHGELFAKHTVNAREVDKPIAGLLTDLKARGLLKDTLVIWTGEFGRTPVSQAGDGRDHNPYGYSIWMAGGGVKGGFIYGATDDFGYHAVENRMHIHDFHATVLYLLGIDHEKLTYTYGARDFRLTDVAGKVAHKIFA